MLRNTVTTAGALDIGDRFYKLRDKKKTVYAMCDLRPNAPQFKPAKLWHVESTKLMFAEGYIIRFITAIDATTEVVFLRHNN